MQVQCSAEGAGQGTLTRERGREAGKRKTKTSGNRSNLCMDKNVSHEDLGRYEGKEGGCNTAHRPGHGLTAYS